MRYQWLSIIYLIDLIYIFRINNKRKSIHLFENCHCVKILEVISKQSWMKTSRGKMSMERKKEQCKIEGL